MMKTTTSNAVPCEQDIEACWRSGDREQLRRLYYRIPEGQFAERTTQISDNSRDVRTAARRLEIEPIGTLVYSTTWSSHPRDITEYLWCWLDVPALKAEIANIKKERARRAERRVARAAPVTVAPIMATAEAAALLRVVPATLCARARGLGMQGERRGRSYIWTVHQVCALDSDGVANEAIKRWVADKYGKVSEAIPEALDSLRRLNRYIYGLPSRSTQKIRIYSHKNKLVELIYRLGLVQRIEIHEQVLPEKKCFCVTGKCQGCGGSGGCYGTCYRCGGTGVCSKCSGTGVYLPEKRVQHHCFYIVGGYSFHQPSELVTWPITEVLGEATPMPAFPEHRDHGLRSRAEAVLDEAILVRTLELAYCEGLLERPASPGESMGPGLASTSGRAVSDPSAPSREPRR